MLGKGNEAKRRGFVITCCSLYTQIHFKNGECMYMDGFWQGNMNCQAFGTDSSRNGRSVTVSSLKYIFGLTSLFNKAVITNYLSSIQSLQNYCRKT
jgi:hypothetical protein